MARMYKGLPVISHDEFLKLREEYRAQGKELYETDDDDDFDEDEIPEGCLACGGPYPDCSDSCPIYGDN